jgi:hypothetical protein
MPFANAASSDANVPWLAYLTMTPHFFPPLRFLAGSESLAGDRAREFVFPGVDLDRVAVLDQADRAIFRGFERDMRPTMKPRLRSEWRSSVMSATSSPIENEGSPDSHEPGYKEGGVGAGHGQAERATGRRNANTGSGLNSCSLDLTSGGQLSRSWGRMAYFANTARVSCGLFQTLMNFRIERRRGERTWFSRQRAPDRRRGFRRPRDRSSR